MTNLLQVIEASGLDKNKAERLLRCAGIDKPLTATANASGERQATLVLLASWLLRLPLEEDQVLLVLKHVKRGQIEQVAIFDNSYCFVKGDPTGISLHTGEVVEHAPKCISAHIFYFGYCEDQLNKQ